MSASVRLGPISQTNGHRGSATAVQQHRDDAKQQHNSRNFDGGPGEGKARILIAAENRLLREALARMLAKRGGFEVLGLEEEAHHGIEGAAALVIALRVQTLVLTTTGLPEKDATVVREVRTQAPHVKILLLGLTGDEQEFLRYIRAGIHGCLLRDATAEDVLGAVRAVHAGEGVCPGVLCSVLFRYFERETATLPAVNMNRELGLTRREQQLIPFIAQGMTNKEIASHFCLSEQTVKNHLYRMKQKVGAYDRLGIVQLCQQQGFLI